MCEIEPVERRNRGGERRGGKGKKKKEGKERETSTLVVKVHDHNVDFVEFRDRDTVTDTRRCPSSSFVVAAPVRLSAGVPARLLDAALLRWLHGASCCAAAATVVAVPPPVCVG